MNLPIERNYWTLSRRYLTLPPDRIMTTREIARLLGTSSPGVLTRMKRYGVVPEASQSIRIMHRWKTNAILAAVKQEWGNGSDQAPISSLHTTHILAHLQALRKTHTIKEIALSTGLSPNVIANWIRKQQAPTIRQRKALLAKYPMLY